MLRSRQKTYPDSYIIRNAVMWLMESADNWAQLERVAMIAMRIKNMSESMRKEHEHLTSSGEGAQETKKVCAP